MNENFKKEILNKAKKLNQRPSDHVEKVREIVRELRAHIEGGRKLDEAKIASYVTRLTSYTIGIPVSIPLSSNAHFTRGVKYLEGDGGVFYKKASRLSYIPSALTLEIGQGRLNKAGESIFYASMDTQQSSVNTVLTEIGANRGDIINLLYSVTQTDQPGFLHVIPIGIMDYFRRGIQGPFQLHPVFKEIYDLLRESTDPIAMEAVHLCDEFMNSILTTKENGKANGDNSDLYDVTCALARNFLANPRFDGILYQSTKASSFPNVALKPTSVDTKLRYAGAAAYKIADKEGDREFMLKWVGNGIIDGDQIIWIT